MRQVRLPGGWSVAAVLLWGVSLPAWATVPAPGPIPGWYNTTFGDTTQGSATIDANGVITIRGAGVDTWGRSDEFHVLYKPLSGDGSVTTKLLTAEEGNDAAKIGVVMRNDLTDPAAAVMFMTMSGSGGGQEIHRGVAGEEMSMDFKTAKSDYHLFPKQFPIWLKIERRADRFTSYASQDGQFWVPVIRPQQIAMKEQIVAGLSVMSHETDSLLTATYEGKVTDVSSRLLKPEEAAPAQPDPVFALGGNNSLLLMWDRVDHLGHEADGYVVYKANPGDSNFTMIAELPGDKTSFVDDTIRNGERADYRVTSIVKLGGRTVESQDLGDHLYAVTGSPSPPVRIGNREYYADLLEGGAPEPVTETPGSAGIDGSGVVTLQAAGWDLYGRNDGGEQLVTPVTGDFTFTARVLGTPTVEGGDVNEWAKFGIAVRETTLSDSRYAAMLISAKHGIRAPHRRLFETGLSQDYGPHEETPAFPVYFRIRRRGDEIRTFVSADGSTFQPYGAPDTTVLSDLAPRVFVGFIGSSHDDNRPPDQVAQAKFDRVELTTP